LARNPGDHTGVVRAAFSPAVGCHIQPGSAKRANRKAAKAPAPPVSPPPNHPPRHRNLLQPRDCWVRFDVQGRGQLARYLYNFAGPR
jgi:hypothetical protein